MRFCQYEIEVGPHEEYRPQMTIDGLEIILLDSSKTIIYIKDKQAICLLYDIDWLCIFLSIHVYESITCTYEYRWCNVHDTHATTFVIQAQGDYITLTRWFERMASSWWTSIRPHQTLWIGFSWERRAKTLTKHGWCLCLLCWNICFQSESHGVQGVRVRTEDSILRHLQDTESHDWLGEITHWATQVTCGHVWFKEVCSLSKGHCILDL